jgi:hypothetical protein
MAEALLIQEHGAIGVLAYSTGQGVYPSKFTLANFYKTVFWDNVTALGEILLGVKLHGLEYNFDANSLYRLTLFGDPALNIMWEAIEEDTLRVDLAVSASGIKIVDGVKNKYVRSGEGFSVDISVENLWRDAIEGVGVLVYDGAPESGTRRDSVFVGAVGAYDTTVCSAEITLASGAHDLYVVVDTTAFPEPTYMNNSAHRRVYVLPYVAGFPDTLSGRGVHSITIENVSPTNSGNELLVGLDNALLCVSSSSNVLWNSVTETGTGFVSGTPCVGSLFKDGKPYCLWVDAVFDGDVQLLDGETGEPDQTIGVGLRYPAFRSPSEFADNHQIMLIEDLIKGDLMLELVLFSRRMDGTYIEAYVLEDSIKVWDFMLDGVANIEDRAQFACGDLDGDGDSEVVVAESNCKEHFCDSLYVLEPQGSIVTVDWTKQLSDSTFRHFGASGVVLLDRDLDGYLEILTAGVGEPADPVSTIYLFGHDGTLLWDSEIPGSDPFFSVSDLDSDGELDIVLASGNYLRILSMSTGAVLDSVSASGRFLMTPLVADIDGDGQQEIVTLSDRIAMVPGQSEHTIDVFDSELDRIGTSFVFPYSHGIFGETVALRGIAMPAIDDVDEDGVLDVAFVSADSVLHVFSLGSFAGDVTWGQEQKNPMQTGVVVQTISGHYSSHVSLFNDVHVLGDVTVDSTLYIDATARVRVSSSDTTHGGVDTTRCEITAKGCLRMAGSSTSPIQIFGTPSKLGSQFTWTGVIVDSVCSSTQLDFVSIENAVTAIDSRAPVSFENCSIQDCQTGIHGLSEVDATECQINAEMGIRLESDMTLTGSSVTGSYYAVTVQGGNVHFDEDTLSVGLPNGTGLIVQSITDSLLCEDTRIAGGLYGVNVQTGSGSAKVDLLNSRISGASITGVYLPDSCVATINGCTITGNQVGVEAYRNSNVTVKNSTINDNTVDGIYAHLTSHVTIEGNEIAGNSVGIYCLEYSSPVISNGNLIESNTAGIKCEDFSDPFIRENKITSNTVGVAALDDAEPDLGACGQDTCRADLCSDQGLNSIFSNSQYDVTNLDSVTVWAQCNYWGRRGPMPSKFYGFVETDPYLGDDPWPSLSAPQDDMADETDLPRRHYISQNYPNPFNPTTTIAFEIPPPGSGVKIVIYDVMGRVVRVLANEQKTAGRYTITWDGTNNRGESVASGMYFLRMSAGAYRATKKLLVLK